MDIDPAQVTLAAVKAFAPLAGRYAAGAIGRWVAASDEVSRAASRTSAEFPLFEDLASRLGAWARSDPVHEAIHLIQVGQTVDPEELVSSFVGLSGFFTGSDTRVDASRVLTVFLNNVASELYLGPEGPVVMMRRIEEIGQETQLVIEDGISELNNYITVSRAMSAADGADILMAAFLAKLELVDNMLDDGRIQTAASIFKGAIDGGLPSQSEQVQYRLASVRGRIAQSSDDLLAARRHFTDAERLLPGSPLPALRRAVVLSNLDRIDEATLVVKPYLSRVDLDERELANLISALSGLGLDDDLQRVVERYSALAHIQRVARVIAAHRIRRGDYDKAVSALESMDLEAASFPVRATLAVALSYVAAGAVDRREATKARSVARRARYLFEGLESEAQTWESIELRNEFYFRFAGALGILQEWQGSILQCDRILSVDPDFMPAYTYKAAALLQLSRTSDVIELLTGRDQLDNDQRQFLGSAFIAESRYSDAISALIPVLASDEPVEVPLLDQLVYAYDLLGIDTGAALLSGLTLNEKAEEVALLTTARRLARCGDIEEADALYRTLLLRGDEDWRATVRLAYADFLYRSGDFSKAVSLYRDISDGDPEDLFSDRLLWSLYRADQLDDALALAQSILEIRTEDSSALELQAYIYDRFGNVEASLSAQRKLSLAHPRNAAIRHGILTSLLRLGRESEARKELAELRLADFQGEPAALLSLASLALTLGDTASCVDLAFRGRRIGDADPNIHLRFLGLCLRMEKSDDSYDRVELGSAVELESADGSGRAPIEFLVLPSGHSPIVEVEISGDGPLAKGLVGRGVGDVLSDASPLLPGSWTIKAVRSRMGFMARETYRRFESRFGKSAGLERIPFKDGDLQPILERLDARADSAKTVIEQYESLRLPLSTVGQLLGQPISRLWYMAEESAGGEFAIRFQRNDAGPEQRARDLADYQGPLVLGMNALWSVTNLQIVDLVLKAYPLTVVPQAVVDRLLEELLEARGIDSEPATLGATGTGGYFATEPSRAGLVARRAAIEQTLAISRSFQVLPLRTLRGRAEQLDERIATLGSADTYALELARERDLPVVSDDAAIEGVGRAEGGRAYSSQDLLAALSRRGDLSGDDYLDHIEHLCLLGYRSVRLTVIELIWLVSSGDLTLMSVAFAQLDGRSCDRAPAVDLMATVLYQCWLLRNLAPVFIDLLKLALVALLRGRDDAVVDELVGALRARSDASVRPRSELANLVSDVRRSLA